MNRTEEQTVRQLTALVERAAAATTAPERLATDALAQAAELEGAGRTRRNRPALRRSTKIGVSLLAAATLTAGVAAATLIGHSDYQKVVQPSAAMQPTIAVSQTVLVAKKLTAMRGDVVFLKARNGTDTFEAFSRVIGLAGDTVSCPAASDGTCKAVIVSGHALDEPWLTAATAPFPQVTVPAGHVFLLSDARDQGVDSRIYGPQAAKAIIGVVIARYNRAGQREPLAGTPPHQLPDDYRNIDPAGPVPPAACRQASGAPCK